MGQVDRKHYEDEHLAFGEAFRASADKVYADSDMAKAWDAAGLQRVMKA